MFIKHLMTSWAREWGCKGFGVAFPEEFACPCPAALQWLVNKNIRVAQQGCHQQRGVFWIAEEPILEELEPLTHKLYKERDQVAQARANICQAASWVC